MLYSGGGSGYIEWAQTSIAGHFNLVNLNILATNDTSKADVAPWCYFCTDGWIGSPDGL